MTVKLIWNTRTINKKMQIKNIWLHIQKIRAKEARKKETLLTKVQRIRVKIHYAVLWRVQASFCRQILTKISKTLLKKKLISLNALNVPEFSKDALIYFIITRHTCKKENHWDVLKIIVRSNFCTSRVSKDIVKPCTNSITRRGEKEEQS